MTASAVSSARSDPARPIAMPVSAVARAGASLTPSPASSTRCPAVCRARTALAFSWGRRPARTSLMPACPGETGSGTRVIAGGQDRYGPGQGGDGGDGGSGRGAKLVGDAQHASQDTVQEHHDGGLPGLFQAGDGGRGRMPVPRLRPGDGGAADLYQPPGDAGADHASRLGREVTGPPQPQPGLVRGRDHGTDQGMLRRVLRGRGKSQQLPRIQAGAGQHDSVGEMGGRRG